MRGRARPRSAAQARSMSAGIARARPAMIGRRTAPAMVRTASKSPSDEIGKPASMMSTPSAIELLRQAQLLRRRHAEAGRLLAVAERGVEHLDA